MTTNRTCPKCQSPLPADAPSGLCPRCLLQGGLGSDPGRTAGYPGFTAPTVAELAPLFPQLEIIELLGAGGMGAVYKARQSGLDRLVALKVLPRRDDADPSFADRFTREARSLAKLNHPGIVSVYDFGQTGGLFYIVMEFVEGVNLRQAQLAKKLSPAEALAIVPRICEALQFAHEAGVVHRDIKPENILLDAKGRVKIADFGLAKLLDQPNGSHLTGTQQVMGTLHYMAPEQWEKPHSVDHRADIYSLGVVFYEMLTGELPLGRFPLPSQKVQVDVRLDDVVLRTLEKEPDRRYQHASDVKTDVEKIEGAPSVRSVPRASSESVATKPNRTWLKVGLICLVLLLTLTGAGFWMWRRTVWFEPIGQPPTSLGKNDPLLGTWAMADGTGKTEFRADGSFRHWLRASESNQFVGSNPAIEVKERLVSGSFVHWDHDRIVFRPSEGRQVKLQFVDNKQALTVEGWTISLKMFVEGDELVVLKDDGSVVTRLRRVGARPDGNEPPPPPAKPPDATRPNSSSTSSYNSLIFLAFVGLVLLGTLSLVAIGAFLDPRRKLQTAAATPTPAEITPRPEAESPRQPWTSRGVIALLVIIASAIVWPFGLFALPTTWWIARKRKQSMVRVVENAMDSLGLFGPAAWAVLVCLAGVANAFFPWVIADMNFTRTYFFGFELGLSWQPPTMAAGFLALGLFVFTIARLNNLRIWRAVVTLGGGIALLIIAIWFITDEYGFKHGNAKLAILMGSTTQPLINANFQIAPGPYCAIGLAAALVLLGAIDLRGYLVMSSAAAGLSDPDVRQDAGRVPTAAASLEARPSFLRHVGLPLVVLGAVWGATSIFAASVPTKVHSDYVVAGGLQVYLLAIPILLWRWLAKREKGSRARRWAIAVGAVFLIWGALAFWEVNVKDWMYSRQRERDSAALQQTLVGTWTWTDGRVGTTEFLADGTFEERSRVTVPSGVEQESVVVGQYRVFNDRTIYVMSPNRRYEEPLVVVFTDDTVTVKSHDGRVQRMKRKR